MGGLKNHNKSRMDISFYKKPEIEVKHILLHLTKLAEHLCDIFGVYQLEVLD